MRFNQSMRLSDNVCKGFKKHLDDSYRIEKLYEETENVLVTLKDKFGTCSFIYFKTHKSAGKGVRVLDNEQSYVGVFWFYDNGQIGGLAEGERGKRRVIQTLKMLEKAISYGTVEIIAVENPIAPSANIPLTPREQIIVKELKKGVPFSKVREELELTPLKVSKIRKSLIKKGIIEDSFDEIA